MPSRPVTQYHTMTTPRRDRVVDWVKTTARFLLALPFDEAVHAFLAHAGNEAEADRAWLFTYSRDATHFRNTHEWCRSGVTGFVESLQDVPVAMIAWLHQGLLRNQAVMINDIERLPKSAAALRAEFRRQGNRTVFCVPVFHGEKIWGCVGFDAVRRAKSWPRSVAAALQDAAALIPLAANPPSVMATPRDNTRDDGWLYLRDAAGVRRVALDSIVGVRAERDYTRVYLHGGQTHLELRPLKTWLSVLPSTQFRRIHRGAIVNLKKITGLERGASGRWAIEISGLSMKWPIGRSYRAVVRSSLGI